MPARRSPEPVEALTRRVVDAALRLSDRLDAVSMPMLAAEAGLAVGTLYRVAPSKEALAGLVAAGALNRMEAMVLAPFPARLDLRARFALMWSRLVGFALDQRDAARHLAAAGMPDSCAFVRAAAGFGRDLGVQGSSADGQVLAALVWGPISALVRDGSADRARLEALEDAVWRALAGGR